MRQQEHGEIYRIALETAGSELQEITTSLEKLRIRKDRLEKLLSVLEPIVGIEEQDATTALEAEPDKSQEGSAEAVQSTSEEAGDRVVADPFQRRIDHVLGIGAGIRDVRKYTRQF
jgi:hypothetical protein